MKEKLNVSFKMEDDYLPPLKTLATISFVILLCSMPLFALNGGIGEYVREYFGIIWHISMFFFINKYKKDSDLGKSYAKMIWYIFIFYKKKRKSTYTEYRSWNE